MEAFGLPTGFGKASKKTDISLKVAQTKRAEPVADVIDSSKPPPSTEEINPPFSSKGKEQATDQYGPAGEPPADEPTFGPDSMELPTSHEILLKDHSKTVSALSLDPSGARLVSGGYDYDCKLWDFGGMNEDFKPFRSWEPREGHQIHDLLWSNTGDSFLCITGANQPQLYDRDGSQIVEFIKGDMYIRDMHHCVGHIAELTSAAWHPKDPSTFMTAAADSTLRIWDVDNKRQSKTVIVVKSKQPGTRTKVTCCSYSPDGKIIAAACLDGTVHLWSTSSNFARPNATIEMAHKKDTWTSGMCWSKDARRMYTRGGDDTVKLWDPKNFRKPLAVKDGLVSLYQETNVILSPDEVYVLTGAAADKEAGTGGQVVLLESLTLQAVRTLTISPANVVRVLWHPRINQLLIGTSSGSIHLLYSPHLSTKGATLSLARPRRRASPSSALQQGGELDRPIITPHALPMFRDDAMECVAAGGRGGKRKRERERQDPKITMKPMPPLVGPGKGGRVGASATQHVVKGLVKNSIRQEDPREALLKFAKEHEGEAPKYTKAWVETMPQPVFDERLLEEEAEAEAEKARREEERKRRKRERPNPV